MRCRLQEWAGCCCVVSLLLPPACLRRRALNCSGVCVSPCMQLTLEAAAELVRVFGPTLLRAVSKQPPVSKPLLAVAARPSNEEVSLTWPAFALQLYAGARDVVQSTLLRAVQGIQTVCSDPSSLLPCLTTTLGSFCHQGSSARACCDGRTVIQFKGAGAVEDIKVCSWDHLLCLLDPGFNCSQASEARAR